MAGALTAALALALPAVVAGWSSTAQAATPVAPLGIAAGGILPYASQATRDSYLSAAHDLGATWLRFDMTWNDIQRTSARTYDWTRYDTVVADAQRYGLQVVGLIGYAPTWAQDPSCAGNSVCHPRSAAEYGQFAGAVAAHYGPRGVHHWEIWNEPNVAQWYAPSPNPAQYTALLKSAYTQIHAADAKGEVIAGGAAPAATGGGNYSPIDFLSGMYSAGAAGSFDIMGTHPYCFAGSFDCPKQTENWSAWTQMAQTKVSLHSVMSSHGDASKTLWATEFGAPTNGSGSTTETHQAQMLTDALKLFGSNTWAGPLFVYSLKDRGTNAGDREDWFGVLRADGSRKPAYSMVRDLMLSSPQRSPAGPAPAATTTAPAPSVSTPAPVSTTVPAAPAPAPQQNWWSWLFGRIFH